ncbi:MAG TPA: monovalent cation/H+ antiporter subunit A [Longimicrobiales bacterium]|nr:monovalent cation/H+ antiporter subunit A [Longimicrobiales bacterium]
MTLLFIVLLPFLGALPPLLVRVRGDVRNRLAWTAALPTLGALALVVAQWRRIFAGEVLEVSRAWVPAPGLDAALRMDGYAWMFACLVLGIGLLVLLYSRYYLSAREDLPRFFASLMFFMGSMMGVVLAGNLVLLVVFWELTSLSSFLLIGFWRHDEEARSGARMALVVTGLGGLALLGGVLLLGSIAGSFAMTDVLAAAGTVQQHPLYVPMLVLVLIGAFSKSAQFPFHFWLPRAMAAPTPISAYLHSATMVKAGVFLLGRLYPVLSGTAQWFYIVSIVGMATLLLGAYRAMFAHDLKGLLAYSTVSHLGLITLLFGFSSPVGAVAAVFHIMNHATFKASLFMAAGIIDHETGTRDMRLLNGLWRHMPYTTVLAVVAAAAMAGVPLLNGFISKEMFFAESLTVTALRGLRPVEPILAVIASMFSVGYSLRFIHIFFQGDGTGMPNTPHEPPRFMRIPVETLVLLCVAVGIAPGLLIGPTLAIASASALGSGLPAYHLTAWHGLNLPLLMSGLALVGGFVLFTGRHRLYRLQARLTPPFSAESVYDGIVARLEWAARWITERLENGSLQRYIVLFVLMAVLAGASPLLEHAFRSGDQARVALDPATIAAWVILIIAGLATAVLHRRRVAALIAIRAVGLMVSLAFVRLSAPDLALTQLLVEIVTIMLVLLALDYLPVTSPAESSGLRRMRDVTVAAAAGIGVGALAWAVMTRPADSISRYFVEQSYPAGGGTNIVNVILVDFRGFDTLGEIAVLGIAALGVVMLLRGVDLNPARRAGTTARDASPVILAMITRALLPIALLFATFLLLRGHNLPGGGFIAGLMAAVALATQYVASGTAWTEERLRLNFRVLTGIGLLCAALTGLGALAFGHPFLSATFTYLDWPVVGRFELATAMIFDIGVFLTVIGAVLLMLSRLGAPVADTDRAAYRTESSAWKP